MYMYIYIYIYIYIVPYAIPRGAPLDGHAGGLLTARPLASSELRNRRVYTYLSLSLYIYIYTHTHTYAYTYTDICIERYTPSPPTKSFPTKSP